MSKELETFLKKLDVKPNDIAIFENAFVHRSALNEKTASSESNEKLEFLGDAVLELLMTDYLYKKVFRKEGELSAIRAAAVKTSTLASVSQKMRLGQFLLLSKGEELTGGREKEGILADIFEAFLGAVYLDQGLEKAGQIFKIYLLPYLKDIIKNKKYIDPKTYLQEVIQEKWQTLPKYEVAKEEGPDHNKNFTVEVLLEDKVLGSGSGFSKQGAEEKAARNALHKLEKRNENK